MIVSDIFIKNLCCIWLNLNLEFGTEFCLNFVLVLSKLHAPSPNLFFCSAFFNAVLLFQSHVEQQVAKLIFVLDFFVSLFSEHFCPAHFISTLIDENIPSNVELCIRYFIFLTLRLLQNLLSNTLVF